MTGLLAEICGVCPICGEPWIGGPGCTVWTHWETGVEGAGMSDLDYFLTHHTEVTR